MAGFVLGFIADLVRSAFIPASTEWFNRFIPSSRQKANVEENILTLDIMEKLKSLGKDPDLVKHARDDATQFMSVLSSQQEAFVETAIEIIDSTFMTQAEMNMEAGRRADVAKKQMERAIIALERSGWMSEAQTSALTETQERWGKYAQAQAEFAAAEFEGGSMAPLIFASELESATVSRTGELKRMLEEMRERYGD
ncbi:lysozyme inhibitor LprI family protein [Aurantimonas sp. A3-2-R12]|uniref:lysozyme inhibitor LprI family protein n=1 Tax=Aurantimonas sp. A3-2-R12 TaxID=3114362 RepID=UPI002E177D7D|nr:lysozyme inhibitor LprI family protein [Aurantimonas sp. A3-2-R12]